MEFEIKERIMELLHTFFLPKKHVSKDCCPLSRRTHIVLSFIFFFIRDFVEYEMKVLMVLKLDWSY